MCLYTCACIFTKLNRIYLHRIFLGGHTRNWMPRKQEWDLNLLYNLFGRLEFHSRYMYYLHQKKMFNEKNLQNIEAGRGRNTEEFPVKTANYAQMFICSVFQEHIKKMLKKQKWYKLSTMKRTGRKLLASEIFRLHFWKRKNWMRNSESGQRKPWPAMFEGGPELGGSCWGRKPSRKDACPQDWEQPTLETEPWKWQHHTPRKTPPLILWSQWLVDMHLISQPKINT